MLRATRATASTMDHQRTRELVDSDAEREIGREEGRDREKEKERKQVNG
jgi:hypothetical protein